MLAVPQKLLCAVMLLIILGVHDIPMTVITREVLHSILNFVVAQMITNNYIKAYNMLW